MEDNKKAINIAESIVKIEKKKLYMQEEIRELIYMSVMKVVRENIKL